MPGSTQEVLIKMSVFFQLIYEDMHKPGIISEEQ